MYGVTSYITFCCVSHQQDVLITRLLFTTLITSEAAHFKVFIALSVIFRGYLKCLNGSWCFLRVRSTEKF